MPGKARRIAARQSQLQRRKKQHRGPRGIPAPAAAPSANGDAPGSSAPAAAVVTAERPPQAAPRSVPEERTDAALSRPGPVNRPAAATRPAREAPGAVNYVGSEIKRILALAGGIVVVIVALAFIL